MEELKPIFRSYGWTLDIHKRGKGTKYVYAARRKEGKVHRVYFAPQVKTEQMSKAEVLERLAALK